MSYNIVPRRELNRCHIHMLLAASPFDTLFYKKKLNPLNYINLDLDLIKQLWYSPLNSAKLYCSSEVTLFRHEPLLLDSSVQMKLWKSFFFENSFENKKFLKICTGCRVSAAKIYIYHSAEIKKSTLIYLLKQAY